MLGSLCEKPCLSRDGRFRSGRNASSDDGVWPCQKLRQVARCEWPSVLIWAHCAVSNSEEAPGELGYAIIDTTLFMPRVKFRATSG
jgi:hypothetical protein